MIEVYPNLFVGDGNDFHALVPRLMPKPEVGKDPYAVPTDWYVISAAKEPWHRETLGYKTRGAPKEHPNYLLAYGQRHLIMNLVDVDDAAYIREDLVEAGVGAVSGALDHGWKVLIHCNQGQSRSPTLALLWISQHQALFHGMTYDEAADQFRQIYPAFAPSKGMEGYARQHW